MKIAFIVLRGVPLSDGIATYTDELAYNLTKKGHDVTVYCSKRYGNKTGMYKDRYFIKTVPCLPGTAFEKLSLEFFATLDQTFKKFDVIHFHGDAIFTFLTKFRRKKTVVQMHGIEHERARWGKFARKVLLWLEKHSYNKCDRLTVVSKALQDYYKKTYNYEAHYIPTAVNLPSEQVANDDLLEKIGLHKDEYFLFMARIVQEKGLHYLINSFKNASICKKLVIAGPIDKKNAYHQEILRLAEGFENIIFVGNVTGELKDALLRGAYAFCQPSETEGLSVALLEAMSYKKCCIISDIPMNVEAVQNCGIVFVNKSVESLTLALLEACNNEDFVKMQGIKAYNRVCENYTWDIVSSKVEKLYLEMFSDEKNN